MGAGAGPEPGQQRNPFSLLYFLPKHTAHQRADEHRHRMQELTGESKCQMEELSTTTSCARRIGGLADLQTFLANIRTFAGSLAVTDKVELEDIGEGRNPPLLVMVFDNFFSLVTGLKFCRAYTQFKDQQPHLVYTMAHVVDSVGAMLAKNARTGRVARKAAGDWTSADANVAAALKFHRRRLTYCQEFTEGGDIPKLCVLFDSSDERKEADAAAAATQREQLRSIAAEVTRSASRADNRRDRGGDRSDRGNSDGRPAKKPRADDGNGGDREGDVVCLLPSDEQMPLPRLANKAEWPCASHYRHDTRCKRAACKRAHIPIENLSPESQKAWMDHVMVTPTLYFNPRRVKIMAEELKKPKVGAAKPAPGRGSSGWSRGQRS